MLRIYDTRARALVPFTPLVAGQVSLYLCGMTTYDDAHIGHARSAVIFDAITRYLRWRGNTVRYVRNFTDIDDKIIRRAAQSGEPPADLAERYVRRYQEDMAALGLVPPDVEPRVSEHIDDIIALISTLVERGHAYPAAGSVWFSVRSDPNYGALSNQSPDQLKGKEAGAKRAPEDFALWKATRPGEPAWDSPWGPGRPGWHIECSAMSVRHLGESFDIHGGGLDLVFPHHENERAQSESAGHGYAQYWLHHGMLTVRGGKMGHSLGNFITIRDLLRAYPAEALRLFYLQGHYRSPLPYDAHAVDRALAMASRLYDAFAVTLAPPAPSPNPHPEAEALLALAEGFEDRLRAVMDQDFNTAAALAEAFTLARAVNRIAQSPKILRRAGAALAAAGDAFRSFSEATGLLQQPPAAFTAEVRRKRIASLGLTAAQVEAQLAARTAARAARDWATADDIRASLRAQGVEVRDTPDGGSDWRILLEVDGD